MRLLLKILMAPMVLILMLCVWICSAMLYCSAYIFGLMATLVGILAMLVLITTSVKNGVILLILAWLISPVGIPMLAVWMIGRLNAVRWWIQDRVYG